MSHSSEDNLVLLTSVPHELEAGMIVAALVQAGIKACLTGQHTSGFRADAPGEVRVLVFEDDLKRAAELLQEIQAVPGQDVDWTQVDVGQPEDEE
ncbi:MAG: DUF2007 domain-containing protein [Planctomycetaceae bacterium]